MKMLRPCLVLTVFLLALTCGLYPLTVTAVGRALFPAQADGSLVTVGGRVRGSSLLGQTTTRAAYFWSRPSAASVDSTTGVVVSGGSNLGPTSPALREAVATRTAALRASGVRGAVPVDLVTASASGLDPHISVEGARVQVPRVAAARGMSEAAVMQLVEAHTEGRTLGLLGEPRVNVLRLNLALDAQSPHPRSPSPEVERGPRHHTESHLGSPLPFGRGAGGEVECATTAPARSPLHGV